MKISLLGEAPNDTTAIKNLLSKKYPDFDFITLLDRIHGSMLDNKKAIRRLLRIEYEEQSPDIIIFMRDLDSLENDKKAKRKRHVIYSYSNSIVDKAGIFLLNIFELEAIILADVGVFNIHYGCKMAQVDDPMKIFEPKEVLINATRGLYEESHSPELFELLNFETVQQNCRYFSAFVKKFDKAIAAKNLA